jgi:hypothetical protein
MRHSSFSLPTVTLSRRLDQGNQHDLKGSSLSSWQLCSSLSADTPLSLLPTLFCACFSLLTKLSVALRTGPRTRGVPPVTLFYRGLDPIRVCWRRVRQEWFVFLDLPFPPLSYTY